MVSSADSARRLVTILVAEDDADDRLMTAEAFRECRLDNPIQFVADGEALMDYLHHRGPYADPDAHPLPGVILLDLNMPRMDGREALREIKSNARFSDIPVVILTTSKAEEDVAMCYRNRANSFITKPVTYAALIDVVRTLGKYWLQIVDLPARGAGTQA
ncbi:response regulator [Arenimonas sp. MALMAid1274]|uniref:response regulator n=1 Tax=Arenimonas sp. MALMAid1274 TaxID=3411630 RepID=UPI003BA1B12F